MTTDASQSVKWLGYVPHLVVALSVFWLLDVLQPVLLPFLLGGVLAYFGDPLVDRIESRGLGRTAGVCIVFVTLTVFAFLLLLLFAPMLLRQAQALVSNLPDYLSALQQWLLPWLSSFGISQEALSKAELSRLITENWAEARQVLAVALKSLTASSGSIVSFLVGLALVPVVTFYLLRDWDVFIAKVRELLPVSVEPAVTHWAKESDEVLGSFMRGQLLVMLALSLIYSIGFWAAGLQYGLLIGLVAGMVSFVPYLGTAVGIALAGTMMWFQTGELIDMLWIGLVLGIGQLAEGMLLTPLLVGDRIGLHPVLVIFAVLAGGQLFGVLGVLLALPVAAVLAVALRHWRDDYVRQNRVVELSSEE